MIDVRFEVLFGLQQQSLIAFKNGKGVYHYPEGNLSKQSYFLEKFADHFAIVKAFDDPAVICTNGTILAANQGFFKISGLTNEAGVTGQNFLDYLSDSSKAVFLAYKDKVRENDPLRPGDVNVSFMDAKGDRKDVRLSCKRLKNIPNTFLIFFKV